MSELTLIKTDQLEDHPMNPRDGDYSDETIDSIVANLNGEWPQEHVLLVRQTGETYQIISGHHRVRAARKAGIDDVWCVVRDLSDEEAYMALATCNNQNELLPIQIGIHALHNVTLGTPGRGQKGGLREYARQVGKSQTTISELKGAAMVYKNARTSEHFTPEQIKELKSKPQHLYRINSLPADLKKPAVDLLLKKQWTVKDTETICKRVNKFISNEAIDKRWRDLFMPTIQCADLVLHSKANPSTFEHIAKACDALVSMLSDHQEIHDEFLKWLADNQGEDSWDLFKIQAKRNEIEELVSKIAPEIYKADFKDFLAEQPAVDLIITDPPYSTDIEDIEGFSKEVVEHVLNKVKTTGRAFICIGAYPREIKAYMNAKVRDGFTLEQVLIWAYNNTLGPTPTYNYKLNYQAILYFKGEDAAPLDCPIMLEQFAVQTISAPSGFGGSDDRLHAWQKPDELATRLISHTTKPGDTVLDPFACTGTFLVNAAKLGRIAKGCDINDDTIELAKGRGCRLM